VGPWGSGIVVAAIAALIVVVLLEEPVARPSPAERGELSFRKEAMCLTCHILNDRGGQNAPPLDGVATKFIGLKGGRGQAKKFFHDHIIDPKNNPGTERAKYPFTQMPSFIGLGEEKIDDICEYLLTLK